ncbi:hypothetical protein CVIRNUC_007872 [Coccomyxa viridis]|uniref:Uncharacterized protein n=1 Tax=Coccomyxa viridis TaxID=1274662 RepID=A0AAV1IBE6_9CHLO|nr:hypothetical protein CVIRNUC_007872 [Coccomyxa viridis]
MRQLGTIHFLSLFRCSPFQVEHRHQCSGWRPQATYMESMRGIADISGPEHDQPASRGSCNVHLSWQQQRTGRKSMMTMSFSAQHWEGLLAILACSDSALRQVVQRWPGIAELTVGDVMHRLLCLKGLLPGCNVAIMVQLQPQLFLGKTTKQLQSQVGMAYDIISRELPCEYVDAMVQEKPNILFIDTGCLPQAVQHLKDMMAYPTDPTSLSNVLWAVKDGA